jgi:CheY-like chemotaxis protein
MNEQPLNILLVEYDALARLRDPNSEIGAPLLIILDLNMPRMSGQEFLAELRDDSLLRSNVVLVLTTSNAASDLMASYEKHVAGYVLKSRVGEKFETLISLLDAYYTSVEFPPSH